MLHLLFEYSSFYLEATRFPATYYLAGIGPPSTESCCLTVAADLGAFSTAASRNSRTGCWTPSAANAAGGQKGGTGSRPTAKTTRIQAQAPSCASAEPGPGPGWAGAGRSTPRKRCPRKRRGCGASTPSIPAKAASRFGGDRVLTRWFPTPRSTSRMQHQHSVRDVHSPKFPARAR